MTAIESQERPTGPVPAMAFSWRRLLMWALLLPLLVRAPATVILILIAACYGIVPLLSYVRREALHGWPSRKALFCVTKIGNLAIILIFLVVCVVFLLSRIFKLGENIRYNTFIDIFYASYNQYMSIIASGNNLYAVECGLAISILISAIFLGLLFNDITLALELTADEPQPQVKHPEHFIRFEQIPTVYLFCSIIGMIILPYMMSFPVNQGIFGVYRKRSAIIIDDMNIKLHIFSILLLAILCIIVYFLALGWRIFLIPRPFMLPLRQPKRN